MSPATPQHNRRTRPDLSHPIFGMTDRLRSAARTGRKLHLDPDHVQLLLSEEIYRVLSNIEAAEIRKACQAAGDNDNSSETFGCGSAPTVGPGTSAGSNVIPMDAASRGASLLLREEAALMRRRKKR